MIYTLVIMAVGLLFIEIFALPFSRLFGLSGDTQALCVSAMRIISASFVFAGANIAFQGVFQALNGGIESLAVSLCRQLLFVFPFVLIFAGMAKKSAEYRSLVWLAFPVAELLSFAVAVILFVRIYRRRVKTL
jgi:Na+-driven multidrug efflux pump